MLGKVRYLKNKVNGALDTLLALNIADHERHKENQVILQEVVIKSRELIALVNADLNTSLDVKHTAAQLKTLSKQSEEVLSDLSIKSLVNRDALLNILENQNAMLLALHELVGINKKLHEFEEQIAKIPQNSEKLSCISNQLVELKTEAEAAHHISQANQATLHRLRDNSAMVFSSHVTSSKAPELRLMLYLMKQIDNRTVIDVGAHHGDFSLSFLEAGCTVYAFEPFVESYEVLLKQCSHFDRLTSFPLALGSERKHQTLFLAESNDPRLQKVAGAFNSFEERVLPAGISFTGRQDVEVTTLNECIAKSMTPKKVGLLKVDTEGFDFDVLVGASNLESDVVVCEYWDEFLYLSSPTTPKLENLVKQMSSMGFESYLVFATIDGSDDEFFYADLPETAPKAWGNVFFFKEEHLFDRAFAWADKHLRRAYPVQARY